MKLKTNKQIYNSAIIKELSVNYKVVFDKSKITFEEWRKLARYLQPWSIIFDNDTIIFNKVIQRRELKLLQ